MTAIGSTATSALTGLAVRLAFAGAAAVTCLLPQTVGAFSWQDALEKGEEIGRGIFGRDGEPSDAGTSAGDEPQNRPATAPPADDPQPSYTAAQVREVQILLTELDYDPGPVDGAYGSATAGAIRRYQADHGLAQTGVPSRELLVHLQGARDARRGETTARPALQAHPDAEPPPAPSTPEASPEAGVPEIIEIAMPRGFKPIRLIALDGLPVAGFPVLEQRGELNPDSWEQAGFDLGDIDAQFVRLTEVLYVGVQPKLLQGIADAEAFAARHFDEQSREEFFPSGAETFPGTPRFGTNEFERKQLFAEFLQRYSEPLREMAPELPFEFTYVEQVSIGTYDEAAQAFPLSTRQGRSGTVEVPNAIGSERIDIGVPAALPMAPQAAQALLERLPNERSKHSTSSLPPIRRAYLGLRLAITGFTSDSNGRLSPRIELRAAGLYEDQLLKTAIHEFAVREEAAPRMASVAAAPLLPHLAKLYAVRDIKGYLSDKAVLESTTTLVQNEQARWQRLSQPQMQRLCGGRQTELVWASARDELARGALLDVLMQPAADWSFLDRETRFGLVPNHCVEVFVFPAREIADREPDFAARAVAAIYRKTLEAAVDELPKLVFVNRPLPTPRYDHAREMLVFGEPASGSRPAHLLPWTSRAVEYLAPGQASKASSESIVRVSKSDEGLAIYGLAVHDNEALAPPGMRPKSMTERVPGEKWRQSVRFLDGSRPGAFALDRLLKLPSLPVEPSVAEQLLEEVRATREAMRAIIVLEIDRAESLAPEWPVILYARLDHVVITTGDGREVAVLDAESFPDAVASYRQARAEEKRESEALASAAAEKEASALARKEQEQMALAKDFATCERSSSAQEKLDCYKAVCEPRQGNWECFERIRSAGSAVTAERSRASALEGTRRMDCGTRARVAWRLTPDTPDYASFLASCMSQAQRAPYGPDILGLRLGMERGDADNLRLRVLDIAETEKGAQRRTAAEPLPFDEGSLNFSAARDHLLAVYTLDNFGKPLSAVISRRLFLGPRAQPMDALVAAMSERYGDPLWNDQRHFLWSFTEDGRPRRDAAAQTCSGLVDLLVDAEWQTYSALDEEITRLAPPTLSARASPSDYAAFADCGVVLIARFNELPDGNVGDFALTLFDPGWIAEQPTFAFTEEVEDSLEVRF